MDALGRTLEQFRGLYRSMSPSQRMTLVLLPLVVVAAFGFMLWNNNSSSYVAVSWGKTFTMSELVSAEQSFISAGLTTYRREGARLMVPNEVEKYNAALLTGDSLPTNWASELEKSIDKSTFFTPAHQLDTMKDVALGKELVRMLEAVPDVEKASVIWTPSKKRSYPRSGSHVTATVYLQPRRGHELSLQLVQSTRAAVANAVPELSPSDVVVFDTLKGKSYAPEKDGDPYDNRQLDRINELTEMYRKKVADALDYIDDVRITVNVAIDNFKSHVEREQVIDPKKTVSLQQSDQTRTSESSQQIPRTEPGNEANRPRSLQANATSQKSQKDLETNTSSITAPSFTTTVREYAPAMPKDVQVAVQIPELYFQKVLTPPAGSEGGATPPGGAPKVGTLKRREQIIADVKAAVTRAVGAASGESITVGSYVQVPAEKPDVAVPWTGTLTSGASRWGGAIGLALFAIWALRMLQKTSPKLPAGDAAPISPTLVAPAIAADDAPDDVEEPKPRELSKRDRLQMDVRDNPEVAASVLSKWIQSAK